MREQQVEEQKKLQLAAKKRYQKQKQEKISQQQQYSRLQAAQQEDPSCSIFDDLVLNQEGEVQGKHQRKKETKQSMEDQ